MRIGIFGTGLMARVRAQQLLMDPRVTWVGLASESAERAAKLADEVGAPFGGSPEIMLSESPDALVVAGASDDHVHHTRIGIGAGIPVLCEKPLATNLDDCRAIVEEGQAAGVEIQVGFQRRFDEEYAGAKALIDDGRLGQLYSVRLTSHDHEPPPELFVSTSGGLFRDLGVHDYDLARWLTGEEVAEVFVVGANRTKWNYFASHEDVDTAVTVLRMQSGLPVTVSSSRHSPDGQDVRAEIFGSNHSVTVGFGKRAPLRNSRAVAVGAAIEPYANFLERFQDAFDRQTTAFVDWLAGSASNPCPAIDGLESLRIATAADRSRREGRPIPIEEV